MKKLKTSAEKKTYRNARSAYFGFITQTYLKRPFGYIISILFIVYLAVIVLIVPKVVHLNPLFIWSNPAFNIPIFNLFFISAAASASAVAIYRTGREDGTDLSLSSKPLNKSIQVGIKTLVYLLTMLFFNLLAVAILAITKPVFGEFDLIFNINGITIEKYNALLLSTFVGNTITMLFFGGISVLVSLVGGQVATMIASIGLAFMMCLLNVIFPIAVSSPLDVLRDKYSTSINSFTANTVAQYKNPELNKDQHTFAAIQCITESDGKEINHFDTAEYWSKANSQSGIYATNYIDFGKQLSSLYSAFGLDETKLLEASKLGIGQNLSHNYKIDKKTHVSSKENVAKEQYPASLYTVKTKQGFSYPVVNILAGDMNISSDNWFATSTLISADFGSCFVISTKPATIGTGGFTFREQIIQAFGKRWFNMAELIPTDEEWETSKQIFAELMSGLELDDPNAAHKVEVYQNDKYVSQSASNLIKKYGSPTFFEDEEAFEDLPLIKKAYITSKIGLSWILMAREVQLKDIKQFCLDNEIDETFPYSSSTIIKWYNSRVFDAKGTTKEFYYYQQQLQNVFNKGIWICYLDSGIRDPLWAMPVNSSLDYCETFNNAYQYKVASFYNVYVLIAIWSIVSIGLFTSAVIVYKKTDFK